MRYVQLSEGGFQVVYPRSLWLSKSDSDMSRKLFTFAHTRKDTCF